MDTDEDSFEEKAVDTKRIRGIVGVAGIGDDGQQQQQHSTMPQCPHCHRYYETEPKLKAHIQKYCLKEKKYKCFYCSYRSKRRDHIRRHMIRVHAVLMNKRIAMGLSMDIDATLDDAAAAEAAAAALASGIGGDMSGSDLNDSNSNYYKNAVDKDTDVIDDEFDEDDE